VTKQWLLSDSDQTKGMTCSG